MRCHSRRPGSVSWTTRAISAGASLVTGPLTKWSGIDWHGGIDIVVSQDAVDPEPRFVLRETNVTRERTLLASTAWGCPCEGRQWQKFSRTVTLETLLRVPDLSSLLQVSVSSVLTGSAGGNSSAITLDAQNSHPLMRHQLGDTRNGRPDGAGNAGNIIVKANQNLDSDFGQILRQDGRECLWHNPPQEMQGTLN